MAWNPKYLLLIVTSTLITFFTAIGIGRVRQIRQKRLYLIVSIILNISILFVFKYFNFFNQTIKDLFTLFKLPYYVNDLKILLPVGISFYTFQALSYTIDVYRGVKKPERHFGIYALYVSFFPQLVAGPIERSTRLLPQFFKKVQFDYNRVIDGSRIIIWGFFKKVVIADRLAIIVDPIYQNPHDYNGIHFIIATVFFGFQIYCDFSGYSSIAIGTAKTLGYELMDNFKQPYFSRSISEFWRRWHISLSTWFRDYLYIPLGGNRVKINRYHFNIMVVFLVSGLWHGANLTFIIWGALHGFYLIISTATSTLKKNMIRFIRINRFTRTHQTIQVFITFSLISFSWIFFRSNTVSDAFYILSHLFDGLLPMIYKFSDSGYIRSELGLFGIQQREFIIITFSLIILLAVDFLGNMKIKKNLLIELPMVIRWTAYYAVCWGILFFGSFNSSQTFIYFQF